MKILIAEDDPVSRRVLVTMLTKLGHEVIATENGCDALAALQQENAPRLAILDWMMPGSEGPEVCRRLRQDSRTASLYLILLTALSRKEQMIAGLEAGADDYLTKPFAFAELIARVKALLRRGSVERPNVLRIGDLEVDRLSQQVRRAGQRIELTAKEYALLEYLAANAGRVLSRTMIIDHVWDQSFDGATNIVDVYVRHLRSKVDNGNVKKLIRTVRGVGYRITDEADV